MEGRAASVSRPDHSRGADFAIDLAREPPFALGGLEVRPSVREVACDGTREIVEPRVMQVLVALASRRGEVVSRDELVARCWGGLAVSEDAITRGVAKLRRLAESRGGFTIETIPRVGFRLIETPSSEGSGIADRPREHRAWKVGIAATLVAVALLLIGLLAIDLVGTGRGQNAGPLPTVAVLPFEGLNNDDNARLFAQSISAASADALTAVGVPVLAPASESKSSPAPYVIRGLVRRDGATLKVWVRLEQPASGLLVMSRSFEVPVTEAATLPDQVAGGLAGVLPSALRIVAWEHDLHLQAKILRAGLSEDPRQGLEAAREAVAQDPDSGAAQMVFAGVAGEIVRDRSTSEDERRSLVSAAREAAIRSQRLLPRFGEPAVADCMLRPSSSPEICEDGLRDGLARDPHAPWVAFFLAERLEEAGRLEEAQALATESFASDPYNPMKAGELLFQLELAGRVEHPEAAPLLRSAARYWRRDPFFLEERFDGLVADAEFAAAQRLLDDPVSGPLIEPQQGEGQPIRTMLRALRTRSETDLRAARAACTSVWLPDDPAIATCLNGFAMQGDLGAAFALAERAFPDRRDRTAADAEQRLLRTGDLGYSLVSLFGKAAAPLRADPRFTELARRTGLISYWRQRGGPDFCAVGSAPVCEFLRHGDRS